MTQPIFGNQDWIDYTKALGVLSKAEKYIGIGTRAQLSEVETAKRRVDYYRKKLNIKIG